MLGRGAIGAMAVAAAMAWMAGAAFAFDDAQYPNLKGQWIGVRPLGRGMQPAFDPYKKWGEMADKTMEEVTDVIPLTQSVASNAGE